MMFKYQIVAAGLAAFAVGPAWAQQQQGQQQQAQEIEMSEVPQAVMEAARQEMPDAQFSQAQTEQEDGRTVYELGGQSADGMAFEVDVFEDGTIQEVEREIGMDQVPSPVQQALQEEMQGFQPSLIEESTRDGQVAAYEFEGTDAQGQQAVIEISSAGEVMSVSQQD